MNEIVPAALEHVHALAPRLRKGDRDEIAATTGGDPVDILTLSVAMSPMSWTWLYKGRVMAMFGIAPKPGSAGVGIPWLLAAKGIERHKVFFVRRSVKYRDAMLAAYPVLENWVDCRNTLSIQWLSWLGFGMAEVDPFHGLQRLPFIRFMYARGTPPSVTP